MDNKEFNVSKIRASLSEKILKTKAGLSDDKNMLEVYASAELTEDELWVLAYSKVNSDRTSMEWEGFYISDIKAHENVQRRFDSLKSRIASVKEG